MTLYHTSLLPANAAVTELVGGPPLSIMGGPPAPTGYRLRHLGVTERLLIGTVVNWPLRPWGAITDLAELFHTSRPTIYAIGERAQMLPVISLVAGFFQQLSLCGRQGGLTWRHVSGWQSKIDISRSVFIAPDTDHLFSLGQHKHNHIVRLFQPISRSPDVHLADERSHSKAGAREKHPAHAGDE